MSIWLACHAHRFQPAVKVDMGKGLVAAGAGREIEISGDRVVG